jgi:hypothetical protein
LTVAAQTADSNPKHAFDSLPPVIVYGLEAYRDKGPDEAVRAWVKGGALEGRTEVLNQADTLRLAQNLYGPYRYFEIIGSHELSSRSKIIYMVFNYDKGPLFAKFVVYRSEEGWILTRLEFNIREDAILPPEAPLS